MRGITNKGSTSNRSQSTCSFCRSPEHQVNKCPHVPIVWASLQKGIVPLEYMSNIKSNKHTDDVWRRGHEYWTSPLSGWYSQGENWGDLFKSAQRAHHKWQKAQEREKNKGKRTKRTATQTCGYCKETGHTRRNCSHQSNMIALLKKANHNFRKWFYEEYVVKQGLSTGAVIEFDFQQPATWNSSESNTPVRSIITAVNWDTINLFAMLDTSSKVRKLNWNTDIDGAKRDKMSNIANFLQSPILCKTPQTSFSKCQVSSGYHRDPVANGFYGVQLPMAYGSEPVLHDFDSQKPLRNWGGANKAKNFRIVSRAPQTLADDWVDGYSDEMTVIFKKFTKAQLEYYGVQDLIKEWANKSA